MADFYIILAYILGYIGLIASSFYIINLFFYKKEDGPAAKDDKTVSIIIPAYNEEGSIERTIKSALNLDYPSEKLEIIIIDDGSKDNTYSIAKKLESKKVRVFTKKNGGKGSALNFGIKKAKGEIVISMDADTFVKKDSLKIMVGHFINDKVWSVAPSMGVYNPKGILARIVQIEYYMGVFLRKSFATVNAIHITPGAFSAYRRSFFLKYGGYDENNLTEDLEVALRIQRHHGIIANASKAVAYTLSPESFKALSIQRRRWYTGLVKNLWNYKDLFGFRYGALGTIILPLILITLPLSIFLTSYSVVRVLLKLKDDLLFMNAINFRFNNAFEFNSFLFKNFFYKLFTQPIFIIALLFFILIAIYIAFSRKQMGYKEGNKINFILFIMLYSFLFTFWWLMSIGYLIFGKKVSWR